MSERFLTPNDNYYFELTRYLRKNSKKTEHDFLKESISFLESNISLNENYSDKDLLIKIKKNIPKSINDSNIDDWLKQQLNYKKEHLKTEITREKNLLFDYKIRINRFPKPIKEIKNNLLNGKQINLYERFLIANEVLQIESKIRTLKISEAKKHNLLSLILGCNIDNAKKIMNGNYDAKVKENLLQDYYKTLIK